jgi:hypothetical protein
MALARVVTFEGGTADGVRAAVAQVKSDVEAGGPPEGVVSNGFTLLADPDNGRAMFIGLFANEDDLRKSAEVLEGMDPPEGMGSRRSVDVYEVGVDLRL